MPLAECWEKRGKQPTSTMWVDVDKGTEGMPDVRCRLVARGFNPHGEKDREDFFVAMPPLESEKFFFQKMVVENARWRREGEEDIKAMFIDLSLIHI